MRVSAVIERALWGTAVVCVGWCLFVGMQVRASRRVAEEIGRPIVSDGGSAAVTVAAASADVIGRIEIPALRLSAPIAADFDGESLRRGVGHIRGTAMPGGLGTVGLAGHRDSFFRPLRGIQSGMDVRLTDGTGTYHYTVDRTEIVLPERVEVLEIRARPELTLVTCYPFDYVGAAPKRFIVHAHLVSASPDGPGMMH